MFQNKAEGKCPFCHEIVKMEDFTDVLSIKEFKISGICQKCQNGFFTEEEE
jgi:hypothetical protein